MCQVWLKFAGGFWEGFKIFSEYFHYYIIIFPWKSGWPFISTNLNLLHPRMFCGKFVWNWPSPSGVKDKKVKSLRTDRQTATDDRWWEKLRWALSSGELKKCCLVGKSTLAYLFTWIFFFQGNVMIVDTPGIGDKYQEKVAEMMLNYIPKALAIVFVLNVSNAGGIQNDRVFLILLFSWIYSFPSSLISMLYLWLCSLIIIVAHPTHRACQSIFNQDAMLFSRWSNLCPKQMGHNTWGRSQTGAYRHNKRKTSRIVGRNWWQQYFQISSSKLFCFCIFLNEEI